MAGQTIPFNFIPTTPSLTDALNLVKKDTMMSLSAHHLGTIQSFNPDLQTATVTINYPQTFFELDEATNQYNPVQINYPILLDCPVICLGGGGASLTFPIESGDECLILFNDRDINNWFEGGNGAAVATTRLHALADAIILVGIRSKPNVLPNYDTARTVLKNGNAFVGVGPELIKIGNDVATLNELLQELMTDLSTLNTTLNTFMSVLAAFSPPSSPVLNGALSAPALAAQAALTTLATSLTTLATEIGEVLE